MVYRLRYASGPDSWSTTFKSHLDQQKLDSLSHCYPTSGTPWYPGHRESKSIVLCQSRMPDTKFLKIHSELIQSGFLGMCKNHDGIARKEGKAFSRDFFSWLVI